jgi:hypothetical protein
MPQSIEHPEDKTRPKSSKTSKVSALLLRRSHRHALKPCLLLDEVEPGLESVVDMPIASSSHEAVSKAATQTSRPAARRRNQR